ncbi:uncharacterized protein LOC144346456 [Saccoglossus kowalevskii]
MTITTSLYGLTMLAVVSCYQDPGIVSNDTCSQCNHTYLPMGEWIGECADMICPSIMLNADATAQTKDVWLQKTYIVVSDTIDGKYRYVAVEPPVEDGNNLTITGENCQFCTLKFRKENWVTNDCVINTCTASLAINDTFYVDDLIAAHVKSFCLNHNMGELIRYTCYWILDIATMIGILNAAGLYV